MEKKVKREDVANLLIKDKYFSKGNNWLKLKQTIIAIIGWGQWFFRLYGWGCRSIRP